MADVSETEFQALRDRVDRLEDLVAELVKALEGAEAALGSEDCIGASAAICTHIYGSGPTETDADQPPP